MKSIRDDGAQRRRSRPRPPLAATHRRRWSACLIVTLIALPACGSGTKTTACTMIGCSSGVTVDIASFVRPDRAVSSASICINGQCTQTDLSTTDVPLLSAQSRIASEAMVTVKIELQTADGRALATDTTRTQLHKVQPNGPKCEPTCFAARLRFTPAGKLTIAA